MSRTRNAAGAAAVGLVAVVVAGCGLVGGDDGSPREWLTTVCGTDATVAAAPAEWDLSDYRAEDALTCVTPEHTEDSYDEVDATAFTTGTDPEDELLASVDGWESGDGMEFRYATRKIADGQWAVVMAVAPTRAIKDGLDRLEGFDVYGSEEVFGRSYDEP